MKLIQTYTVFCSRRYRIVLMGALVFFLLLNTLVPIAMGTEVQSTFSALFIGLMSTLLLYGDMEVFAGIYNREGGRIASCQSSFYGEKTIVTGVLADRIAILLWIFCIGSIQLLWGESYMTQSIQSMLTGCALVYSFVTIGVNVNRFLLTTQGVMLCSMFGGGIASVCAILFFLVIPVTAWWPAVLALAAVIALTIATVCIASCFVKRSYSDV